MLMIYALILTQTNLLAVSSIFFISSSSSPGWNPLALAQRICLTADKDRLTFPMVGVVVCLTVELEGQWWKAVVGKVG